MSCKKKSLLKFIHSLSFKAIAGPEFLFADFNESMGEFIPYIYVDNKNLENIDFVILHKGLIFRLNTDILMTLYFMWHYIYADEVYVVMGKTTFANNKFCKKFRETSKANIEKHTPPISNFIRSWKYSYNPPQKINSSFMEENNHIHIIKISSEYQNLQTKLNLSSLNFKKHLYKSTQLTHGKNIIYLVNLNLNETNLKVAIKVFKKPNVLKHWVDKKFRGGIRAQRVWNSSFYSYAQNIPTPKPIAFLYDSEEKKYYYICKYHNHSNFRDELNHIYTSNSKIDPLLSLINYVALNIRQMHDKGFTHGDLGNQNILLKRSENYHYSNIAFIDLDRSKVFKQLTLKQRAKDLSRINLPSEYLRIFKHMYFEGHHPPQEFERQALKFHKLYKIHRSLYYVRHPIKYLKKKYVNNTSINYKDIWIWDDKTAQPMIVLNKKDRKRYINNSQILKIVFSTIYLLPKLYYNYKKTLNLSYQAPINLNKKIIISLHHHINYHEPEKKLLDELKCKNILLRFCQHEPQSLWNQTIEYINQLADKGININIALLQSRKSITNPETWDFFVNYVIKSIADKIDYIEIGHAVNRVKWGVWDIQEYVSLLKPIILLKKHFPQLKIVGPAIIDFEWPIVLYALKSIPKNFILHGTGVHLYVDRRGAPESFQNKFSTLEKCVLNKSISNIMPQSENKFFITETNWPLENTNVYSPISASYLTKDFIDKHSGESEANYANYMIRYIVIALCSGHVESINWWRLSAHGYGLVDDKNSWRKRPAFYALKTFIKILGESTFIKKLPSSKHSYYFLFKSKNQMILLAWSLLNEPLNINYSISHMTSLYGTQLKNTPQFELTKQPIYFWLNSLE